MTSWCASILAHPALDAVRPYASRLARCETWPSVAELDALLRDRLALETPMALESQAPKPRRRRGPIDREGLYAVRIARHGRIPSRERSWHDLTNALVWAAFPRSKRALAARQLAIVEARVPLGATALPGARTREEDALAMLDEGGVVLAVRPESLDDARLALREGSHERAAQVAWPHVFGHALMEHAIEGRPDVRGYAVILSVAEPASTELVDAALAPWIANSDELCAPAPWRGLPLEHACRPGGASPSR